MRRNRLLLDVIEGNRRNERTLKKLQILYDFKKTRSCGNLNDAVEVWRCWRVEFFRVGLHFSRKAKLPRKVDNSIYGYGFSLFKVILVCRYVVAQTSSKGARCFSQLDSFTGFLNAQLGISSTQTLPCRFDGEHSLKPNDVFLKSY